jgi:hypothetical protein
MLAVIHLQNYVMYIKQVSQPTVTHQHLQLFRKRFDGLEILES